MFPLWARGLSVSCVAAVIAALASAHGAAQGTSSAPATFARDVLPILQRHCQVCHRPGQIGPMSLLDYESARPWARAIKDRVLKRDMPPWFAEPGFGHFSNDRSLKPSEIDTLVKWVDGGAVPGDRKDAPPPITWPADGWRT